LKNFTSDSAYQWNGEDWSSKVSWVIKLASNKIIIVFNFRFLCSLAKSWFWVRLARSC
jgi:hypothetical protein